MGGDGDRRPVCTIIGGPNGSGKSSLHGWLGIADRFLNADVVARGIDPERPEAASMAAGRQVLAELARTIEARESFIYETTLSSSQSIGLMRRARRAGYEVNLVFVALESADLNVERIANRVARGGHDIPEAIIRRRHETSFRRLPEAIRIAEESLLFDNSDFSGPRLLVRVRAGVVEESSLDDGDALHRRLAEAVRRASELPPEVAGTV